MLAVFGRKFSDPPKSVPKMAVFREIGGLSIIIFYFQNPQKAHPCVGPRLLAYFASGSEFGPRL